MLDCTDRHFRVLMRQITRHSLLYTEMVVAQALHHARREPDAERPGGRLERLIGFDACERPLSLQVGGDEPALLADAARLAADWGYDEINLNVGCPSEKVRKGRFGACLMADPDRVARCVAAMVAAGALPVTVKHRIGIDDRDSYPELLAFVDTVAAAGCRHFSVHAETEPHDPAAAPRLGAQAQGGEGRADDRTQWWSDQPGRLPAAAGVGGRCDGGASGL